MFRSTGKQAVLLLLTAVTVIGGYAFLRYAYRVTDRMPFTQEIVLIILGTVATVLITALLLNKQTAVEIEKEQSLKFIELKTRTYEQLIDRLEEMSLAEKITERDLVRMQFITHRLAIFSSPPVLKEFHHFLEILQPCARDAKISDNLDEIFQALAALTVKIRADLIGDLDLLGNYTERHIRNLIISNSDESRELKIDLKTPGRGRPR